MPLRLLCWHPCCCWLFAAAAAADAVVVVAAVVESLITDVDINTVMVFWCKYQSSHSVLV